MRIAIDVAAWRTRSVGLGLFATAVVGLAVAAVSGLLIVEVALAGAALAAVPLVFTRGAVVCRRAELAQQSIIRTLTLLSLPHFPKGKPRGVEIAASLSIRIRPLGGWSLLTFSPANISRQREEYLMHTLLKYQRSIRTIL